MRAIELTRGVVAIVDDENFESLAQWRWHTNTQGYAVRTKKLPGGKTRKVYMHREIMGNPEGVEVDHRNGNTTDNRRENLRVATKFQNEQNRGKNRNNTSGYKGVGFDKLTNRWTAKIDSGGKTHWLGRFKTAEEASLAYNAAAQRLHGEFANFN